MTTLRLETLLPGPPERAFDLAIDLEEHTRSAAGTGERTVATTAKGALALGDEVTFEARHLGLRWRLTSRITQYERPHRFVDQMVRGPFRSFRHEHLFEPVEGGTRMTDVSTFAAPGGTPVERAILKPHLERFLRTRADHLRRVAERRRVGARGSPEGGSGLRRSLPAGPEMDVDRRNTGPMYLLGGAEWLRIGGPNP